MLFWQSIAQAPESIVWYYIGTIKVLLIVPIWLYLAMTIFVETANDQAT